jgi:transcriptional regulator
VPRVIEDKAWFLSRLNELTDTHESSQAVPWKVADAPVEYIDRMLDNIVGLEIPIASLVGKWKVSQNRPDADKRGVVAGLLAKGGPVANEMADLVERHVAPRPRS